MTWEVFCSKYLFNHNYEWWFKEIFECLKLICDKFCQNTEITEKYIFLFLYKFYKIM
jgi:hypothetical protein